MAYLNPRQVDFTGEGTIEDRFNELLEVVHGNFSAVQGYLGGVMEAPGIRLPSDGSGSAITLSFTDNPDGTNKRLVARKDDGSPPTTIANI